MKNILNKSIYALILLLSGQVFAQVDRSKLPEPGPAPKVEIGNYETFTLPNGLKVFVVENRKLPRVAFSLVLDNDPVLEGNKAGYVQMAGELLRRGTKSKTKSQLDEEIDFIGARLSTSSSGIYASSLTKHSEKLAAIMADVLLNPIFPEEELEKIRKQTLSGLQAEKDDPNSIVQNVSNVLIYGKDHPYGEIITEETVSNVTVEDIKNYYQTYFKPNVAYLAIVGDISKKDAEKLVKKYFKRWKKGTVPKADYEMPVLPPKTKVVMVDRPNAVQSVVNIVNPVDLKPGDEDDIKAKVMNQILGGGLSGRLFLNLRETHGYTYGAYSSLSPNKLVGKFSASANVRNDVTDSAIHEFIYEINRIRQEKPTTEELESVISFMSGNFARSLENPQTVASFAINTGRYNLPEDYYTNYLKNLSDVNAEEIQVQGFKYLKPENSYIVVVGKASEIANQLKQFGELEYNDIYGNKYVPKAKSQLPYGMDAQKVLDKYFSALGGKEKLRQMQDLKMVMGASVQGMDVQITNIIKGSDRVFSDTRVGGQQLMKYVRNGDLYSFVQQGQDIPLDDTTKLELKIGNSVFKELDFEGNEIEISLKGIEELNNKEVFVLEVVLPTGGTFLEYFDLESGLKVQESRTIETPMGKINHVTEFKDYKEVDGILFPHTIIVPMGPQKVETTVSEIEINKGINDNVFLIK